MIEDEDEGDKILGTGSAVKDDGRTAEPEAGTFGMDDMRGDLRAGLRRKSKGVRTANETRVPAGDPLAPAALGDPLNSAYLIVGSSALFTATGSTLLLHLIGGLHLDPVTLWLAPVAGAGLFALLGVLLARSSVVRPR